MPDVVEVSLPARTRTLIARALYLRNHQQMSDSMRIESPERYNAGFNTEGKPRHALTKSPQEIFAAPERGSESTGASQATGASQGST